MRAARVHHAARRRGGVAARGARAAAGDAGDRISQRRSRPERRDLRRRVPPGPSESATSRASNVAIEYRWAEVNTIGCRRWRPSWFAVTVAVIVADGDIAPRCGQGGNHDDSDRLRDRRRPGQAPASSPASTGRAATSPASLLLDRCWRPSGSNCCASWCPTPRVVGCSRQSRTIRVPSPRCQGCRGRGSALGSRSSSLNAATAARSTPPSRACAQQRVGALLDAVRPVLHQPASTSSSRWRRAMRFPRSMRPRVCRGRRPDELRHQLIEAYRQVGIYAGRILKGEKPADLPVSSRPSSSWSSTSRPPRRSASTVPPTLLARADEVIE